VLVSDVEHGKRLIHTNNPALLEPLRYRPSHATGPRRYVENPLIALQDEHFSQFLGEISADPRGSAIKLRRVLRIMEMSLVPMNVAMSMFVTVAVLVVMSVLVIMGVLMPVFVTAFMSMIMFVAVLEIVTMLLTLIMNVRMAVAMFVTMLMVVSVLLFVIMRMFVFMVVFFAHGCIILSSRFSCAGLSRVAGAQHSNGPKPSTCPKLSHKASCLQG
jgi:hypothetical protein